MYYIHKYEVAQQYGGPEEGGWWYDSGNPCSDWKPLMCEDEEQACEVCRTLNHAERERARVEERYGYDSVLAYRSTHYAYDVTEDYKAWPYPKERPHYE